MSGTGQGDVELEVRGRLQIPTWREAELPDGRTKQLRVWELTCEDSWPKQNSNTQVLKNMRVEFFEVDYTHQEPQEKRTSWLTAETAHLQLSHDEKGRMIVDADKQMEFWKVKFTTAEDATPSNRLGLSPKTVYSEDPISTSNTALKI